MIILIVHGGWKDGNCKSDCMPRVTGIEMVSLIMVILYGECCSEREVFQSYALRTPLIVQHV